MVEVLILKKTPSLEEMSALVAMTVDHTPGNAHAYIDLEKGEVVMTEGRLPRLLSKAVSYPDAYDYIARILHQRPIFGSTAPVFNPQKWEIERI